MFLKGYRGHYNKKTLELSNDVQTKGWCSVAEKNLLLAGICWLGCCFSLVDQRWKSSFVCSWGQQHLFEHETNPQKKYLSFIISSLFSSYSVSNQVCRARETRCTMTAVRNPTQMWHLWWPSADGRSTTPWTSSFPVSSFHQWPCWSFYCLPTPERRFH